jgi:single-strand DNA-binding protein
MNLAILVGTISSEIRVVQMPKGGSLTKFRMKTVQKYHADGELKESSQTHLIDVWSDFLQKTTTPYLKEGQMIEVQGAIETRNIAKPGEPTRFTTSITLRGTGSINVFGGPGSNMSVHTDAIEPRDPVVDHHPHKAPAVATDDGLDDDVPF